MNTRSLSPQGFALGLLVAVLFYVAILLGFNCDFSMEQFLADLDKLTFSHHVSNDYSKK